VVERDEVREVREPSDFSVAGRTSEWSSSSPSRLECFGTRTGGAVAVDMKALTGSGGSVERCEGGLPPHRSAERGRMWKDGGRIGR
jgi:hypothetical protein